MKSPGKSGFEIFSLSLEFFQEKLAGNDLFQGREGTVTGKLNYEKTIKQIF